MITLGAKQRVFAEAIEETLLKRFLGRHSVASGIIGHLGRYNICQLFSHFLVTHIAVQSVISNSVKSFWQDVLNHSPQELEYVEGLVLDLSGFVVAVPVADRLAVIAFNPAHRDRWRYDILGQISSQPLSSGGHFAGLQEGDKALGIVSPGSVDVSFNRRIGNIVPEHFQEMVLPFSVHHLIGDIRNAFPLFQWIKSSGGHEDMQVGVVMAGTSGGLQDDDVSDIELTAAVGIKNIFETLISCPHEGTEQFGITIKPGSQELRHGQDHMAVSDTRQEASSDEIGPAVGIDLGARQAKAGLAGEGNAAYFSTVAASVLNKTHLFGIAAVEHFLDGVVVIRAVKSWVGLLKRIPMIVENLLEHVFVNTFHGYSLRTTIPELTK